MPPGYGPPGFGRPPGFPPAKKKSNPAVIVLSVCLVVVVLIGGLALLGKSRKPPVYADAWDPRVQYAVTFIEKEKGLPFEHPVFVDFLPEDQFVASVTTGTTNVSDEQRTAADDEVARLRALGLVQGDVDLLKEETSLRGSGTAALYDPKTKHIRVRGTEVTLAIKGTLVHELTHAWQDQHYDLTRLPLLPTAQEQDAFRTIAEGDAVNSENAWIESLPESEQKQYDDQREKESDTATTGMKNVPDVLVASFSAPYAFGPAFMRGLEAGGGADKVDQTWSQPPASDDQILNPWHFLDGPDVVKEVRAPSTGGAEPIDEGTFGELFIYLMLAEHIDPHAAMAAADNWAGDAYALTDVGGQVCVKARIETTTAEVLEPFRAAFTAWAAELPHVKLAFVVRGVEIDACDPGADADLHVTGRSSKTMNFPAVRLSAWAGRLDGGDTQDQARCYADAFVANLTLDDLSTTERVSDERITALRDAAAAACPR
jgi:hypothetical protein